MAEQGGCVEQEMVTVDVDDLLWLISRCTIDGAFARERVARIAKDARSQLGRPNPTKENQ